jgi:hypothetical protein
MIDPVALAEAAQDALDRFVELTACAEFGDGWSSGRSSSATTTSDQGTVRERRVNVDFQYPASDGAIARATDVATQ